MELTLHSFMCPKHLNKHILQFSKQKQTGLNPHPGKSWHLEGSM